MTALVILGATTPVFASHNYLSDSAAYMSSQSTITLSMTQDETNGKVITVVTPEVEVKESSGDKIYDDGRVTIEKVEQSSEVKENIQSMESILGRSTLYGESMWKGLHSQKFITAYENTKTDVTKSALSNFSDLGADAWYNDYIAIPVYFNVLNGYDDGTLRPNGKVTSAEVAKIVATAYEGNLVSTGNIENPGIKGKWYSSYYARVGNIFTYNSSNKLTDKYMTSPMRRCEIAFVLANACNDGTLNQYITKAQTGDLSSMAGYTDFHDVVEVSRDLESEQQLMASGKIPARFAGAIMYLKDKGIMVGDGAGHISPLNTVSRAEVFKLIQETCKATTRFGQGAFANTESIDAQSKDIVKEETQTPVQTTSTGSGVYLDGSGAFHSVNEQSGKADGQKAGDTGLKLDSTNKLWKEMQSRKNIKVSYSDAQRPRLKAGDVFVAQDGTEYTLQDTGVYMLDGTPVMGVGLPIAMDLGRSYVVNGRVRTVTDGYRPDVDAFGADAGDTALGNLCTQTYIVFDKTGEGHWSNEWDAIKKATNPNKKGIKGTDGQISADGYWRYDAEFSDWSWIVK